MTAIITDFPHKIIDLPDVGIPMPDGIRLSARIWMPDDAAARPVPAVLEYIPYRKRDGTLVRDELMHPYVAGHGYACVRVDMRGNGDSEARMLDEYTRQEMDDALGVIGWLARQAAFEDKSTELDHMMHIVGSAKDKSVKKWYYIKNSWGNTNTMGGFLWMRDDYFKMRTLAIIVNKAAIPKGIRRKMRL